MPKSVKSRMDSAHKNYITAKTAFLKERYPDLEFVTCAVMIIPDKEEYKPSDFFIDASAISPDFMKMLLEVIKKKFATEIARIESGQPAQKPLTVETV